MASPFVVDLLPASVRQALPAIESGVSRNLSISAITRSIQVGGIITSPSSVSQAVKLLRRTRARELDLLKRRRDRVINVVNLPVSLTNIKRNVSYTVEITTSPPDSNAKIKRQITVSTDKTDLTRRQVEDQALEIFGDLEHYEGFEAFSARLIGGKKSPLFEAS